MSEPMFCTAETEIEINDEVQTLSCTQRFGHLEDHSAKVWWSGPVSQPEAPNGGEQ